MRLERDLCEEVIVKRRVDANFWRLCSRQNRGIARSICPKHWCELASLVFTIAVSNDHLNILVLSAKHLLCPLAQVRLSLKLYMTSLSFIGTMLIAA